jgi:spore maturation protein CgeB
MVSAYNRALVNARTSATQLIWVDKGIFVQSATLQAMRAGGTRWAVHYSPDNYFLGQNTSRHLQRCLPLYDVVVTTKPANVARLKSVGARKVLLSGNSFDPATHHPVRLNQTERGRFAADVAFIGRREAEREQLLGRVAGLGVDLAIWGPGWSSSKDPRILKAYRGDTAVGPSYTKAICGAKVVLGLLSKTAADTITQRSVEIPACGAFMLAERTPEHQATFAEGAEAEYFAGFDELAEKLAHYLSHDAERIRVADAGRQRCISSGYSYPDRLKTVIDSLSASSN